jgi:hypothetical protein
MDCGIKGEINMQTITKHVLTQVHYDAGLYTVEEEDFLYLYSENSENCIVVFSSHATLKEIWREADKWISNRDLLDSSCKEILKK